jgi:hypothetical protein
VPGAGETLGLGEAAALPEGLAFVDADALEEAGALELAGALALVDALGESDAPTDAGAEARGEGLALNADVPIASVPTTSTVARIVMADGMRTARWRTRRGR